MLPPFSTYAPSPFTPSTSTVVAALAVIFPPLVPNAIPFAPTFKVPPPFKATSELFPSA